MRKSLYVDDLANALTFLVQNHSDESYIEFDPGVSISGLAQISSVASYGTRIRYVASKIVDILGKSLNNKGLYEME